MAQWVYGMKERGDQGSRAWLGELVDVGAEECLATAAMGPAVKVNQIQQAFVKGNN